MKLSENTYDFFGRPSESESRSMDVFDHKGGCKSSVVRPVRDSLREASPMIPETSNYESERNSEMVRESPYDDRKPYEEFPWRNTPLHNPVYVSAPNPDGENEYSEDPLRVELKPKFNVDLAGMGVMDQDLSGGKGIKIDKGSNNNEKNAGEIRINVPSDFKFDISSLIDKFRGFLSIRPGNGDEQVFNVSEGYDELENEIKADLEEIIRKEKENRVSYISSNFSGIKKIAGNDECLFLLEKLVKSYKKMVMNYLDGVDELFNPAMELVGEVENFINRSKGSMDMGKVSKNLGRVAQSPYENDTEGEMIQNDRMRMRDSGESTGDNRSDIILSKINLGESLNPSEIALIAEALRKMGEGTGNVGSSVTRSLNTATSSGWVSVKGSRVGGR
jgi:hypothetical protein